MLRTWQVTRLGCSAARQVERTVALRAPHVVVVAPGAATHVV